MKHKKDLEKWTTMAAKKGAFHWSQVVEKRRKFLSKTQKMFIVVTPKQVSKTWLPCSSLRSAVHMPPIGKPYL